MSYLLFLTEHGLVMGVASLRLLEDSLRILFELLDQLHVLGRDSGHGWLLLGHKVATSFSFLFNFRILLICSEASACLRAFWSLRAIHQERQVLFSSFFS